MKSNEFVFDYVHLLYYKCHKINQNRGGSYIYSSNRIKKKATINPMNKKVNDFFLYVVTTVVLNHEEIGKHAEIITKTKPFINKYEWGGINFPSGKDQKELEKNNVKIVVNVLYATKEKIYPVYVSKNNSNHEKQVVFLIYLNGEKSKATPVNKKKNLKTKILK